jgi:magnesium transporter
MIAGLVKDQNESVRAIASLDELRAAIQSPTAMVWIDIESPSVELITELDAIIDLDDDALHDCLEGEQRPRVDDYGDYLFLVLYGMLGEQSEQDIAPRKLAIFLGKRYLITIHRQPLRTPRAVYDRTRKHPARSINQGVAAVLVQLINGMVANYRLVMDGYEEEIEELEVRAIQSHDGHELMATVADLRRRLVEVRRLAESQRELLEPLFEGDYDLIPESLEVRFGQITQAFAEVLDNSNELRERLDGVRDSFHATLAQQTNDTMKVLTIVATITLPMSLVAGMYGMNVPLWPDTGHLSSLFFALGLMVVAGGGLWLYLRLRRLI